MPEPIVIDASAIVAIIRREPGHGLLRAVLRSPAGGASLMVPGHFWLEVLNVLVRRYGARRQEAVEALREIDEFELETVEIDRPTLLLAVGRMAAHGLSAYDAAYLALAEVVDGRLLTLDRRLAEAAGDRAILSGDGGPRRTSEARAPYDPGRDRETVAGFGAYLAELRRRAEATA
jgi:predicted nucleic acid-binding protein